MKELTLQQKKNLLKKWRWILTRYSNLRDNNWIRTTRRGNVITNMDCSRVKESYLNNIENAKRIISELSPIK